MKESLSDTDIAKLPRFSWADPGVYVGNTGYLISEQSYALLGILQSRVTWLAISQLCQPLRLRAGYWQYRNLPHFLSRLPIPDLSEAEREGIGGLAEAITVQARARYALHDRVRRRILSDLGGAPGKALNNRLTAWWDLEFPALRAELKKCLLHDIALKKRDEWEEWLALQKAEHQRHTAEIVRLETALNARVYALFSLTPPEIATLETQTKYPYGTV